MSDPKEPPRIRPISPALNIPVFNVVIYIAASGAGVQARVANLPDLVFAAPTEPMALKQAITEVKARLSQWCGQGEPIPWIDPVPEPMETEQERLVPVHLYL